MGCLAAHRKRNKGICLRSSSSLLFLLLNSKSAISEYFHIHNSRTAGNPLIFNNTK